MGTERDGQPVTLTETGAVSAARAGTSTDTATRTGTVVFLGTSLTAGYGLGEDQAYPALLQEKIDSAGLPFRVVNAGLSGETSAGGLRRLEWTLQQPVDVLVIELGANDGLRGLDTDALRANLDSIIVRTQRRYPQARIVILGMEAPPNHGGEYTRQFRDAFASAARDHNAAFLPFLLQGVAANGALNLDDGIHPNAEGHRRIARNVWSVLGPVLTQKAAQF
jgi:acyl-CoA thioesterase-1